MNMNWNGNLDSSIGKNTRLVIWRSEVRIPVQVQIFLFKSKMECFCCKLLLPIDKALCEIEISLNMCSVLLNVPKIYLGISSLFFDKSYSLYILISVISVLSFSTLFTSNVSFKES